MSSDRRTAVILLAVLAGLLTIAGTVAVTYTTRLCLGGFFDNCSSGVVVDRPYFMLGAVAFVLAAFAGLGSLITYLSRPREGD